MVSGISSSTNSYLTYLQTHPTKHPSAADMFKKIDTDSSGGISQSELDALATDMSSKTGQSIDTSKAISTYDADGNGELSSEEMDAFMKSTMQQGVGHMGMQGGPGGGPRDLSVALDTDGSGEISQSELETWAQNMSEETGNTIDTTDAVSTYDTDSSGELSSSELKNFLDASGIPSPETAGMAPPPPPPPASESSDTNSSSSADSVISKYDTNGDGVLSATELQAYLDDQSSSSSNSLVAKALSAYVSSLGSSQTSNLQDLFMSLAGNNSSYSPMDFSI